MENMAKTHLWLIWVTAAMLMTILTYNPIILLTITLTLTTLSKKLKLQTKTLLKIGLIMGAFPLIFNTLFVDLGSHTLIHVSHPLPIINERLTLESILFGLTSMLLLTNTILAFGIFNEKIKPDTLARTIPKQLAHTAIIILVGLRFVPTLIEDAKAIHTAQKCRGLKTKKTNLTRRLRNYSSLLLPLLTTSLERAHMLAEAMESRGYTAQRTNFARITWERDLVVKAGAVALGLIMYAALWKTGAFSYWPYEKLTLPTTNPLTLAPILSLLAPAIKTRK